MSHEIKDISKVFTFLAKDYAENLLKILVNYTDISASEAASRLDIHIKTAQEFLEALAEAGFIEKTEVIDKKRPYFRYKLIKNKILIEIDLHSLKEEKNSANEKHFLIREKMRADVKFTTARYDAYLSNVVIWVGSGRNKTERRINLTVPQGKFLYHLPFPTAKHESIANIMKKAALNKEHLPEIMDIVNLLIEYEAIEKF